MAAITLEQTTLQELTRLIEVVGQKSFNLVQGIKTSVAPQLNKTIADTIDSFQKGGLKTQNNAINALQDQMRKLGVSVEDLTSGFEKAKDIPAGLKSLQDAMRFREKSAEEAEKKVQELRKAGVIAEIEVIAGESKVNILSQKEVIQEQKQLVQDRKELQKSEKEISEVANVVGTDIKNPDFVSIARAYGFYSERVANIEEFKTAFDIALNSKTGAVLDLVVDPEMLTPQQSITQARLLNER